MKEEKKTEAWKERFEEKFSQSDIGCTRGHKLKNFPYYESMIEFIKKEKEASYKEGQEKERVFQLAMTGHAFIAGEEVEMIKKQAVNEVLVEVEKMIKKVDEDGVDPFDYVAGAEISAFEKVLDIISKK